MKVQKHNYNPIAIYECKSSPVFAMTKPKVVSTLTPHEKKELRLGAGCSPLEDGEDAQFTEVGYACGQQVNETYGFLF